MQPMMQEAHDLFRTSYLQRIISTACNLCSPRQFSRLMQRPLEKSTQRHKIYMARKLFSKYLYDTRFTISFTVI